MNRSVRFVLFLATFVTANVAWGDGRQISAGFNYTCAVSEGEVVCWGDNEYGQTNVPALTNPTYVSAGGSRSGAHTCAVAGRGVVCWGDNEYGQTNVPALTKPTLVDVGEVNSCALDDESVVCWGGNDYGQSNVPRLNAPTRVSAGKDHACAIDNTGVVCWGYNSYGQATPPSLDNPKQVSAGSQHTCALHDTGVVCWGRGAYGRIDVPSLRNPIMVSAGTDHSCALDDTGVVCWGRKARGKTTPPELNKPSSVVVGNEHSCATDVTGVVCWGHDGYNQTLVPMALTDPSAAPVMGQAVSVSTNPGSDRSIGFRPDVPKFQCDLIGGVSRKTLRQVIPARPRYLSSCLSCVGASCVIKSGEFEHKNQETTCRRLFCTHRKRAEMLVDGKGLMGGYTVSLDYKITKDGRGELVRIRDISGGSGTETIARALKRGLTKTYYEPLVIDGRKYEIVNLSSTFRLYYED